MIVDVNVPNLANAINSLKSIISEYEEIELNLFNQLNDSCVNNWQDKYSKEFEGKMQLDKQEAQLILESLNEKKEVYNFIHDRYGEIARKIKVNLSGRSRVISSLERCYNNARTAINLFNSVDTGYRFGGEILAQKAKIEKVKNEISDLKIEVNNLYNKIEEIEQQIKAKINALEVVNINPFEFHFDVDTGGI